MALILQAAAHAQVRQAIYNGGDQAQPAARQANQLQQSNDSWVDAYGNPVIVPASYCGQGCAPMACPPGGGPGMFAGGLPCGNPGGGPYGPGGPFCAGMGMDPYAAGGVNLGIDQCGPHYFDFSAEAVYWKKERSSDPTVNFATIGINDISAGVADDLLLNTDDLDFDWEPGMRLTGRYDLGAMSMLEVQYSGLYEWGAIAGLSGSDDIYSAFSNFGIGIDTTGDGNPDQAVGGVGLSSTEQASAVELELLNELHNAEISIRRYWVGASPRVTGTWMAGFRYTRLTEDLNYGTSGTSGNAFFATGTTNDLCGFQAGGDMWMTIRQGFRVGAQGKAGIYNNRMESFATITSTQLAQPLVERVKGDRAAFITEGNVSVVFDVMPNMSLRAGYDVLFLNTVALAANNFNFDNAPLLGGTRTPVLIEESSSLYHGANVGLEYVW
ncbi:Lpg1974 family pore-forming outer membrane protein [Aeoliella mucimassa]|uniref:Lpg1974 family pore-forming outer membrane protein n=1 Tax=Aeoliella mucimassa TaxID=2527972 RepID=UPI0018D3C4B0|nr:Lpg1974 family pore-forming outer membrane protein [Aeoliella mucimassa]